MEVIIIFKTLDKYFTTIISKIGKAFAKGTIYAEMYSKNIMIFLIIGCIVVGAISSWVGNIITISELEQKNLELTKEIHNIKAELSEKESIWLNEKEEYQSQIENLESQVKSLNSVKNRVNSYPISRGSYTRTETSLSLSDEDLLARLVWLEGRGESDEGQQAIVEVVLNRVKSNHPSFPNTVSEVIYRPGQFTPASQIVHISATEKEYRNVRAVLSGGASVLPNENYVYFATSRINGKDFLKIGNHWFSSL